MFYEIFTKDHVNRIQAHIIDLYNLRNKDGSLNSTALKMKTQSSFKNWYEQLKGYKFDDVINVIDQYHKTKSNITPPQVYKIVQMLGNKKQLEKSNTELKKPICPVPKWQDEFDKVLQKACTYGIVYNPYWVSKGYKSIGETYVRDVQGNLTRKTWKMYWKEHRILMVVHIT